MIKIRMRKGVNMPETKTLALAGLNAASFAWAGAAGPQEIKLTLADQNSPTGWLARAAALGEASRGGNQGPRQDRGLSIAYPDQGRGHVEGHSRRHRRYRLVRAGLLARANAVVGRHVAAVPADQLGREGKRS